MPEILGTMPPRLYHVSKQIAQGTVRVPCAHVRSELVKARLLLPHPGPRGLHLVHVKKGRAEICAGNPFQLEPGSHALLEAEPGLALAQVGQRGPLVERLRIDVDFRAGGDLRGALVLPVIALPVGLDALWHETLTQAEAARRGDHWARPLAVAAATSLLVQFLRAADTAGTLKLRADAPPAWLLHAGSWFDSRFADPSFSVSTWAKRVGLSPSRFRRVYKEYIGVSPRERLTARRLELAQQLLLDEPNLSVTEIAERAGYTDASRFSKAFRQRFGLAPTEWRDRGTARESPAISPSPSRRTRRYRR
jgi:AraC-like DNA-binding protein